METAPDAFNPAVANDRGSPAERAAKDIAFGSVSQSRAPAVSPGDPHSPTLVRTCQVAGMASKVLEHPFDLTKVRLQAQVLDSTARFSGPLDCLAQTYNKEGVRGLYRVRPFALYPPPPSSSVLHAPAAP